MFTHAGTSLGDPCRAPPPPLLVQTLFAIFVIYNNIFRTCKFHFFNIQKLPLPLGC